MDCHLTFEKLLDGAELPAEFRDAVGRISYSSASCKINVALERLPSFTALPGHEPGPQHLGTVHLCPDQDFIERAYDDAKYGSFSREPVVECTMPSSLDSTVAPPGKHLMSMFTQYAPYRLKDGPWTDALRNEYADRCFDIVERYAPGFKDVGDRSADSHAGRSRSDVRPDRRQHLPRSDAAASALRVSPGSRLCGLRDADSRTLSVRRGGTSRRRRHGRRRLERRPRDAARQTLASRVFASPGKKALAMELRPLGFGEIFDRAVTLYIRNFVPFAAIVMVVGSCRWRSCNTSSISARSRSSMR